MRYVYEALYMENAYGGDCLYSKKITVSGDKVDDIMDMIPIQKKAMKEAERHKKASRHYVLLKLVSKI